MATTIRTKGGEYVKVMIEIQRSDKPTDMLRFRTYIGEQYKQLDTVTVNDNKIEDSLPIVVIYMLGFPLSSTNAIGVKADRRYFDIIKGVEIESKDPFIECLTHDGYFIQIPRISADTYKDWENCSELEQMLSLFEQDYFVDGNFLKKYPYPLTNKNIKKMVETLEYIAADPKLRRAMQEEYWAAQNETLWEKEVKTLQQEIIANKRAMAEKDEAMAENKRIMAAKDEAMAQKDKALAKNKKAIAQKDKAMAENAKIIAEKDKIIADLQKQYGLNGATDPKPASKSKASANRKK